MKLSSSKYNYTHTYEIIFIVIILCFYCAIQNGDTALHFACRLNQTDTIQFFLTNGADPNLKNNEDKTPLDLVQKDKELIMQIVETKDSLKKGIVNEHLFMCLLRS